MSDHLEQIKHRLDWGGIQKARKLSRDKMVCAAHVARLQSLILPFKPKPTKHIILDKPVIEVGKGSELDAEETIQLEGILKGFIPWKKGPFRIFGFEIDSEWRSDLKWERLERFIPNLENKMVADVGCHNGYFMFRMAAKNPKLVLGFEPAVKQKVCFDFLQSLAQVEKPPV